MKYIKKFEELDFSQTLPITSKNALTMYYSCDECDAIWRSVNKVCDSCLYCKSNTVEELSEDEWYEMAKSRSDDDEIDGWDEDRMIGDNEMVDINQLGKNDNN